MQRARCRGCSIFVTNVSARRKLDSRATRHVIPVFREIVEEKYPGYCVTEAQLVADDSYLCLPCFRRLDGVINLQQQLADKRKKIAEDLEKSVSAGAVSVTERVPEPSTPLPPAKRPRTLEEAGSTPRRRRRRLDTPTRHAIG